MDLSSAGKRACGFPLSGDRRCRNQIPVTEAACHLHREELEAQRVQESVSASGALSLSMDDFVEVRKLSHIRTAHLTEEQSWRMSIMESGLVPSDLVSIVAKVCDQIASEIDLDSQQEVAAALPVALNTFTDRLLDYGVPKERMTYFLLTGSHTLGERAPAYSYDEERRHIVTCLDPWTDEAVLIDPFTSILLPPTDGVPVSERFSQWLNPLTQAPLIAHPNFYFQEGGHIWFDEKSDIGIQRFA